MLYILQTNKDAPLSESSPHISNIGKLVEEMENKMRNTLNEIYFGKTRDISCDLRYVVKKGIPFDLIVSAVLSDHQC